MTTKQSSWLISVLLVTCLLLGFSAAGPVLARSDTMVIGIPNEPNALNYFHMDGTRMAKKIAAFLYDPLIHQDPETLEYIPSLAKSWEVSEDGLVWTFQLRDDVYFHNGDHLTAADFKFTFDRMLTDSPTGANELGPLAETVVVDDYTFQMVYSSPYLSLPHHLAHGHLGPISQRAYEEVGADFATNPLNAGTGPYKFSEWLAGESITIVRNDDYAWGPEFYENRGAPHIGTLKFMVIPELEVSTLGVMTGELDAVDFLPDKDVAELDANPDINLFHVHLPGMGLYSAFNVSKPPFDDVDVRKALSYAVDKETIIRIVKHGNATVGNGPFPFFWFGYLEELEDYYYYDPDRANQMLDDAGWVMGSDGIRSKDGVSLSGLFLVRHRDDYILSAQLLQEMFRVVGVELEIQILEWGTLLEGLFGGDHNYALMGHGSGEPGTIAYTYFHSSNTPAWNLAKVATPEMDALLEQERVAPSMEVREELLKEIQRKIMIENAYWIPIYNDIQYTPVNARIEGVKMHPNAWFLLNDATISY